VLSNQIYLSNIVGSPEEGYIRTGDPVVFDFNWYNSGPDTIAGWRNGFRFWMVGDGPRSVVTIDSALHYDQVEAAGFDHDPFIGTYGPGDGSGADTIGTMAVAYFGNGMFPVYDDLICRFTVSFDSAAAGDTFCIDSSYFPYGNGWTWVTRQAVEFPPGWPGPYCFEIVYSCCRGHRGNVDDDAAERVNIADLTYLVAYIMGGGEAPPCLEEANINGDLGSAINIEDITYLVAYLFANGPPPPLCP
jgi:hypothetical protein